MSKTSFVFAVLLGMGASLPVLAQPGNAPKLSQAQVTQVQQALKTQGYDPGTLDGTWGAGSQTALTSYQANRALPDSHGQIDQNSLNALGIKVTE